MNGILMGTIVLLNFVLWLFRWSLLLILSWDTSFGCSLKASWTFLQISVASVTSEGRNSWAQPGCPFQWRVTWEERTILRGGEEGLNSFSLPSSWQLVWCLLLPSSHNSSSWEVEAREMQVKNIFLGGTRLDWITRSQYV